MGDKVRPPPGNINACSGKGARCRNDTVPTLHNLWARKRQKRQVQRQVRDKNGTSPEILRQKVRKTVKRKAEDT